MALCRFLNCNLSKLFSAKCIVNSHDIRALSGVKQNFSQERFFGKGYGRKLRVMRVRRKIIGPERMRRRNEWEQWNYKAELYAFNRRLHENITEQTLRCAFTHDSYIKAEEQRRKELDLPTQDVQLDLKSNSSLIAKGQEIASDFAKVYLRYSFRFLPEEGIIALHNYLLSDKLLAYISSNLGTKDLILCPEYPPEESILASSLLAIIGSIASDDSVSKAEKFVLDFICMQLIGKDIFDIWELEDPSGVLNGILRRHGMMDYEPRLIFESGRNSIEAIYSVGLYSDKIFLGRGPGETLPIAEEIAAYNCLRELFQIREAEKPFSSRQISKEELLKCANSNPMIEDWSSKTLKLSSGESYIS